MFGVVCIASDKIDRDSELAMIKGRLDKIAYDEARLQNCLTACECVCVLISAGRRKFIL